MARDKGWHHEYAGVRGFRGQNFPRSIGRDRMRHRSIGRYLVLFINFLVGHKIVSHALNVSQRTDDQSESAKNDAGLFQPSIGRFTDEHQERQNEKRQKLEESYWFWTKIGAVIAAIGAIFAAGFAGTAFKEAQRQANAAEEANRPWLDITNIKNLLIDSNPYGVIINNVINIKNVGHSPARNVFARADVFNGKEVSEALIKKTCDNKSLSLKSVVIFPEEEKFIDANVITSTKYLAAEFRKNTGIKSGINVEISSLIIYGCISYQYGLDGAVWHRAGFSYRIFTKGQAIFDPLPLPFVWHPIYLKDIDIDQIEMNEIAD